MFMQGGMNGRGGGVKRGEGEGEGEEGGGGDGDEMLDLHKSQEFQVQALK